MAVLEEPRADCVSRGYYDPTTAQFTAPDPLFALTGSRYGYAGNDPINGTDPTGLFCVVHNSSGGCLGSGVVHNAASYASSWVPNCVTIGNSNCTSLGDSHPVARDTLYVTAGAAATVASGGLALDGLAAVEAGEGLTTAAYLEGGASTLTGGFVAYGDHGRCSAGDEVACVAMWSGFSASALGGLGMLPGEAGLMLAWLGFAPAGVGLGLDAYALGDEVFNALGCH